jgi:tetratricopeptide (TPR) repeat protein
MNTVAAAPARNTSEAIRSKVPDSQPGAPPSPLALQLEAAIESGSLIEPEGSSAWDIFQQLSHQPDSSSIVAQVKPMLGSALLDSGLAIVRGDVRSDNISQMVDEFKRAGQLFSRARSLMPGNDEAVALEKLSAAAALIALQFFDEAEMSLSQIRGVKLAAVENALGIVFRGKLDDFRAERAFKRSIDLDPKWASPHYNLALLYKSAKRENVIEHLSRAAELDPSNPRIQTALGDEHFESGQWQPAIDAYRKAISLKRGDDALHTKLGHALYSQGLRDEANSEYQKAAELRKRRP